ncbi:MAG: cytidine deaminase [Nitrospirae bacterium CG_4_10_14_3_um_filter_44_29]|nr:cytidine deaminase [Nitrospirota bacterium]OIO28102.1 MAG: cytidine deaminase [Nitrospirae bacterium CG1_02_44_142]PIP69519.1 MAG: cytidine deaminase [Nitrospirae bacterium CG22_combo_CG10-13_8_21_14_all_44_11]PIV42871.1 MAG: cytidine deaminase [Nitrospirae bacterium CG02_land_8_20_14_3_00_44_33]PIV65353.1 MAG: cytidine deaminase [Nitrospirae bacterium CG01_land_8_20_14_3_00_44_22]PIX89595.1 MAG: cytidine deaminase [Nitrospirae bacterium CG_4_10_14_3_um_filter_44_29]PJA83804.1 MAG: cytidin
MLTSDIERLLNEAKAARKKAFAPYSKFTVGAALITNGGKIYHGCNIENPSLMLSFCAERAALINALVEGEKKFKALAIVSGDKDYCFPCGSCRQMLAEFAPGIEIYLASGTGIKKFFISELLPHQFKKSWKAQLRGQGKQEYLQEKTQREKG